MMKPEVARERVTDFVTTVLPWEKEWIYIGIDPGRDGAIAFLCRNSVAVVDMPIIEVPRKRSRNLKPAEQEAQAAAGLQVRKTKTIEGHSFEFDVATIHDLFTQLKPVHYRVRICLEIAQVSNQTKKFRQTALTGYKVGMGYAIWLLYLHAKRWPLEKIEPSAWKRHMGLLGKTKAQSRIKAIELFPNAAAILTRVDRAEALLLAEWSRRIFLGGQRGGHG